MENAKANNYQEIENIIKDLDFNYKGDKTVLKNIYNEIEMQALNISKLKSGKERLLPIISKYTKIAYMRRGNEGMSSSSENGIHYAYTDIIEDMKKDIINNRLRRVF